MPRKRRICQPKIAFNKEFFIFNNATPRKPIKSERRKKLNLCTTQRRQKTIQQVCSAHRKRAVKKKKKFLKELKLHHAIFCCSKELVFFLITREALISFLIPFLELARCATRGGK
jgi:hypothetical protein